MAKFIRVGSSWKEVVQGGYYIKTDVDLRQVFRAWIWDGTKWVKYYDNPIPITITTQINAWDSMTVSWNQVLPNATYKLTGAGFAVVYEGPLLTCVYNNLDPLSMYPLTLHVYVDGNEVAKVNKWSDQTPEYPELGLTASAASNTAIDISWSAKNGSVDQFVLKRGTTSIYSGLDTSKQDTGLPSQTEQTYTLEARRGTQVIKSSTVKASTAPPPTSSASWYGPKATTSGGWTQSTLRNLNGPTFPMPVNGYISAWNVLVWSYGSFTGQFNPHIGGNYKGIRNCPGGRNFQGVDGGNMYLPAGSYTTGAQVGGNSSYATEWDAYEGVTWNYNVAIGQINYWWYTTNRSSFKVVPEWWHSILDDRNIDVELWGSEKITRALVKDQESGEVLIDWVSPDHQPQLY